MVKTNTEREDLIAVALGDATADLVIKDGMLVNVLTAEIYRTDIAVKGNRIASIDAEGKMIGNNTQILDAKGKYLVPGLIEPHYHSYHTYITPTASAQAILPHGTTAIAEGFYGQGIVGGKRAIRFFLEELKDTPLKIVFLVPPLSYLQNRELGLPPAPDSVTAKEMKEMLSWPECYGLEEPPYIPILEKDPIFIDLFKSCLEQKKIIIGMACGISIRGLNAYVTMGPLTDHENVKAEEAVEKTRRGLKILMREGSGTLNVTELSKAITKYHIDPRAFAFCVDLATPDRLLNEGHLDANIRAAVSAGIEPVTAIQMTTINPAEILRVNYDLGSITPGKIADILLVSDLKKFMAQTVVANGKVVARDGTLTVDIERPGYPKWMYNTVKLKRTVKPEGFNIKAPRARQKVRVWVIGAVEEVLLTEKRTEVLKVEGGVVQPDIRKDVLKIAMIDRFNTTGNIGNGFVQGFGLERGALGMSVNAVCENILVVGTNGKDMSAVANRLAEIGGGMIAVVDNSVKATVNLPLLGLLSDNPLSAFIKQWNRLHAAIREMGCTLKSPITTLEFTGVSGEMGTLKICDKGYFEVESRKILDATIE